jgi:hypothetical protein
MAPPPLPPRRGGRRAAIVASLLLSHCAVFGLGYSWHSLWGDYQPAHSSLAGVLSPATASASVLAGLQPGGGGAPVSAAAAQAAALRAARAGGDAAAREEPAPHHAAADATAALAAAERDLPDTDSEEDDAAVDALAEQLGFGGGGDDAALASVAEPARGEETLGRVLELGQGGSEEWIGKLRPYVKDNMVIYTWTNYHMRDFLLNFLLHLKLVRCAATWHERTWQ